MVLISYLLAISYSYYSWIKNNKAQKSDEIYGLIICNGFDDKINSALVCVPFIKTKVYRKNGNDEFIFMDPVEAKVHDAIKILPKETINKIINQLKSI